MHSAGDQELVVRKRLILADAAAAAAPAGFLAIEVAVAVANDAGAACGNYKRRDAGIRRPKAVVARRSEEHDPGYLEVRIVLQFAVTRTAPAFTAVVGPAIGDFSAAKVAHDVVGRAVLGAVT